MPKKISVTLLASCILSGIFFLALSLGSARAASYCERLYDSSKRDYYSLLKSDRKQRFHDSWEKVIEKFTTIYEKYPTCSRAPDALFNVGVLYRKLYHRSWVGADLDLALGTFQKLQKRFPGSRLADDALLNAAQVQEEKGRKGDAYRTYAKIVKTYPKSDMTSRAKKRLDQLASFAPKPPVIKAKAKTKTPSGKMVNITDVKHWSNPEYTRVVVYATGKLDYEEHRLKSDPRSGKPPRLYIDLNRARIPSALSIPIPIRDGLLLRARLGQYNHDTVRLVLDIDSMGDNRVFTMENPSRLVVDVFGRDVGSTSPRATRPGNGAGTPLPLAKQLGLGVKTIVLDPGHGGKDPGAVGRGGLKEKDVTLAIAKLLKPQLEAKGYRVLMTRNRDVYVGLDERTAFANKNLADLFVSIHTNASRNRHARGVETYFLGVAMDRDSSETALLENAITEQTLADLEKILLDLTRTSNLKQSSLLAESIQENLYHGLSSRNKLVKDHGVKQASFYVLIGAQMPAVLVETSFISHPTEEKLLKDPAYQKLVSKSILHGILDYVDGLARTTGGNSST
ncbi:MAG: tetratricopeptide repeat protein [Deltaproteobacteria bacterium]|nr:tetratricopeptide repeat protein [Deltaproteobacteria bacterium]